MNVVGSKMREIVDLSKECFSIGFKGKDDIDLKELISSLDGTIELINIVSNHLDKNSFIKINVSGTRSGSFVVDMCAIAKEGLNLINSTNMTYAKLCIDTVCALLTLKKHLKGENAKSVIKDKDGNVIIENKDAEKIIVNNTTYNIYGVDSNKAMQRIFSKCDRDGFYIENEEGRAVEIDKDDFKNMVQDVDSIIQEKKVLTKSQIIVSIKKADFLGESKWELIYKKRSFKASIKDSEFLENLHGGKISITSKTNMEINLITETYLNEIGEEIKTVHYVEKVIDLKDLDEFNQIEFRL